MVKDNTKPEFFLKISNKNKKETNPINEKIE